MGIQDLLTENLIKSDLSGENKYQVIEELLDLLVSENKIDDRETCLKDLNEREQYLSTGLENGLAIPHAKTTAVNELLISFGISRTGLDFASLDGKPAHFIFLVISPRDVAGPHIQILAQLSRNFKSDDLAPKIMSAQNNQEILNIIKEFK
jgi:fructose-specific phosphotransferase system IIA component